MQETCAETWPVVGLDGEDLNAHHVCVMYEGHRGYHECWDGARMAR